MNRYQLYAAIERELTNIGVSFTMHSAPTGSDYFIISSAALPQIRISNHTGHRQPPRSIEYRTDAATKKEGTRQIFGKGDELRALGVINQRLTKK